MLCPGSRRRSTVRVPIQASSEPTTTHGRLEHGTAGSSIPSDGSARRGAAATFCARSRRPAGRRTAGSAPTTTHGRLRAHDDARQASRPRRRTAGLSMPWCRPSICSIWCNARFNDFSHTWGFRSSKTPPQTRQPVLGDGQGVGAYSKSKLLRLVRYCDEVED